MHALPGTGPGPGHINIFVKRLSLHVLCKSAWRYMEQLALHKEALGATLLNFHLQRMALHMGSVWRYMESVWRYIVSVCKRLSLHGKKAFIATCKLLLIII